MTRRLIVNADDLGLCRGVNRGIFAAVDDGIVTSAGLMVRWPGAVEAAAWALRHPDVSIGLHLDLGEWVYRDGDWRELYHVIDSADPTAVAHEVVAQLQAFERLLGRPPTHLDSHQHVHRNEPVRSLVLAVAARVDVPVRESRGGVRYCGSFYGQSGNGTPYPEGITPAALTALLEALPDGVTELSCHPGADDLSDLDSPYRDERATERRVLCDPSLPGLLASLGIELCSFADVVSEPAAAVPAATSAAPDRSGS